MNIARVSVCTALVIAINVQSAPASALQTDSRQSQCPGSITCIPEVIEAPYVPKLTIRTIAESLGAAGHSWFAAQSYFNFMPSRSARFAGLSPITGRVIERRFDAIQAWASAGDADAQFVLGLVILVNPTRAAASDPKCLTAHWISKSALQSHPHSIATMAVFYAEGWGVESSTEKAFAAWQRAVLADLKTESGMAEAPAMKDLFWNVARRFEQQRTQWQDEVKRISDGDKQYDRLEAMLSPLTIETPQC